MQNPEKAETAVPPIVALDAPGLHIRLLLIEDNPGDRRLIQEMLQCELAGAVELETADSLSSGLTCASEGDFDLMLLDLSLPDSQGLDTFTRLRKAVPDTPIVVLTGLEDRALAMSAARQGAQDYLTKGELDGGLLVRSVLYAIERHRLLVELELARQKEQQQRELRDLQRISASGGTTVTASTFGLGPLRERSAEVFDQMVTRYSHLLDLALEQRTHSVDHHISGELRVLADEMAFMKATPRDVVLVHTTSLEQKGRGGIHPQKAQALAEEGRMLVLELMGYLASSYSGLAQGFGARTTQAHPESNNPAKGDSSP